MMAEEWFELVDETDQVIGRARRTKCHGNPRLIHRTAHIMVFHPDGRVLLQKRSAAKDIQPGRWDTAVGGHLQPGEDYALAARRELVEELGVPADLPLQFLFDHRIRNAIESEQVRVFATTHPGPFCWPPEEIAEVRFWTPAELWAGILHQADQFTPNLVEELTRLRTLGLIAPPTTSA